MASSGLLLKRLRAAWHAARSAWAQVRVPSHPNDLTEVLDRSSDAVVQVDAEGQIVYLNRAARALMGQAPRGDIGRLNFTHFAASGTRRQLADVVLPALQTRGVWVGEIALRLQRQRVPFSLMVVVHRDPNGGTVRFSAVLRDISVDVQARLQTQRQNDILRAISEALPATVVIVDSEGRYRFVNSAFERYVGLSSAQILGRTAVEVLGADEVARRRPYMRRAVAGEAVEFTLDYPGVDGRTYLALSCIPLNLNGRLDGFVGISQDVTAQRREQERLAHLAERDPLTGLLNRAGLQRCADHALGEDGERALLYIDLDHFKPVNDRFGHQAGDQLLQMFARRLGQAVRSSDVVARLGGDEFAILLMDVRTAEVAEAVAAKVLLAARAPFEIEGQQVTISASIGVAVMRRGEAGLDTLMSRADALLYQAKAAGRGRHHVQTLLPVRCAMVGPPPDKAPMHRT